MSWAASRQNSNLKVKRASKTDCFHRACKSTLRLQLLQNFILRHPSKIFRFEKTDEKATTAREGARCQKMEIRPLPLGGMESVKKMQIQTQMGNRVDIFHLLIVSPSIFPRIFQAWKYGDKLSEQFLENQKKKNKAFLRASKGRHDTQNNDIQHNDTQHNDTQHNGLICDTQPKWHSIGTQH